MSKTPSVSLVTPSYNQGQFIGRTVASVLNQEVEGLEYLVCDGASTDNTGEALARFRDTRMRVLSEPDDGQADAVRKGFEMTSGEIVGYLNSDDLLLPGSLARVAKLFRDNPGVDAIYSHRVFINASDDIIGFWRLPRHSNYCMRRWDYIPQETCFWRRRLMDEVGGIDATYQFALDYDLFERMMTRGRFLRIGGYLGAFRQHAEAKTSTMMEDVGAREVSRVRRRVGMSGSLRERITCHAFGQWILKGSALYGAMLPLGTRRSLQGQVQQATQLPDAAGSQT